MAFQSLLALYVKRTLVQKPAFCNVLRERGPAESSVDKAAKTFEHLTAVLQRALGLECAHQGAGIALHKQVMTACQVSSARHLLP